MDNWSVYLGRCKDDSLYVGVALDVDRRLEEHREGKRGAKYLRGRAPLEIVLRRELGDRSLALKVELRIKKLSRKAKESMIENPQVIDEIAHACLGDAS